MNDDDSFSFNSDFSSPMQKIKISTVASGTKAENPEERRETQERIDEERKHQTDVRCGYSSLFFRLPLLALLPCSQLLLSLSLIIFFLTDYVFALMIGVYRSYHERP